MMQRLAIRIRDFVTDEGGPTSIEYAIMVALIVILCLPTIVSLGTQASFSFGRVSLILRRGS